MATADPPKGNSTALSDIIVIAVPEITGYAIRGDPSISIVRDFLTFLAKMGLTVRDDPKKVVDIAGRTWGEPVDGLALSLQLKRKEDADELPSVSVAIRNSTGEFILLRTRGWLDFFEVSLKDSRGIQALPTSYGQELMKPERRPPAAEVEIAPGKAIEADIPIGSLYQMKGHYSIVVSCGTPNGDRAISNAVEINA